MQTETSPKAGERTLKIEVKGEREYFIVLDSNGNFYAKTYSGSTAKLIAAGPALLEACKLALMPKAEIPALAEARRDKCRAAIAQAEGRAL